MMTRNFAALCCFMVKPDMYCWSLQCPVSYRLLCMAIGKYTKCIVNSACDLFVESCEIVRPRMHQSRHKYGAVGVISVTWGAWCRIWQWAEDVRFGGPLNELPSCSRVSFKCQWFLILVVTVAQLLPLSMFLRSNVVPGLIKRLMTQEEPPVSACKGSIHYSKSYCRGRWIFLGWSLGC